jgi:uncharacterized protein involved in exopolysaccharide biosynthesis
MQFSDIIRILITHWKRIFSVTSFATILFFPLLYIFYPLTFVSNISILPPETKSGSGLSSLLQGGDLTSLMTTPGMNSNSQLYGEILKSHSAAIYVVKKLNLMEYLDKENLTDAANKLSEMLSVEITKEGIIKLNVPVTTNILGRWTSSSDSTKILAVKLTTAYVEALDLINRTKLSSKAKRSRIYLEEQLKITRIKLDTVEKSLMNFQKENKTISLPEQIKVSLETAAKLKGEIITNEINLGLLSQNLTENSNSVLALKSKLEELNTQYKRLENSNQDFFLAFKDAPELGIKLSNLLREVKILNEVYLMLQQLYYKELIQENKDIATVEILDPAIVPTKSIAPRVVVSTILAAIFIFLFISLITVLEQKKIFLYKKN